MTHFSRALLVDAQKNVDVLSLFIPFCTIFHIYLILLYYSLAKKRGWLPFVANRNAVLSLFVFACMGSLYLGYCSLEMEKSSVAGIFSVIIICAYLYYLYYNNPVSLMGLPDRLQKLYLLFVIITLLIAFLKMIFNMVGYTVILVNAHTSQILLEELMKIQPQVDRDEPNKPFLPCPLEPAQAPGGERGVFLQLFDQYFVTPAAEKIIQAPTEESPSNFDLQSARLKGKNL